MRFKSVAPSVIDPSDVGSVWDPDAGVARPECKSATSRRYLELIPPAHEGHRAIQAVLKVHGASPIAKRKTKNEK
jgi:hypothetical protein